MLADGVVTSIGRGSDNTIQITSDSISRHHLKLDNTSLVCVAEDLGSTNGTLLNGRQISKCELKHNDVIIIGGCHLRFEQIRLDESEDMHARHVDYSDRTQQGTVKIKSFKPEEGRAVPADIKTEKNLAAIAPLTLKKK